MMRLAAAMALCAAALAQDAPPAAPEAPRPPQPDYIFAFAAPDSTEQASALAKEYAESPAQLLVLAPAAGVDLPEVVKPLLVIGRDAPLQRQGQDSLLLLPAATEERLDGEAHLARRRARASRWSIGFIRQYVPMENPRLDLVLLRDDPLDYLITAASPALAGAEAAGSPFGPTVLLGPGPDAASLLLFAVTESGVRRYAPPAPPEG